VIFNGAEPLHKYMDDMIIAHYIRQGILGESIVCFQLVSEIFRKIINLKFIHYLELRDFIYGYLECSTVLVCRAKSFVYSLSRCSLTRL